MSNGMPQSTAVDLVARERIDSLKEEIRQMNHRVNHLAEGAIEKIRGDAKLVTRVEQLQSLVDALDEILIRGGIHTPSLKSQMDNLRVEIESLKKDLIELRENLKKSEEARSSVEVAKIESRSLNWKATATLIAAVVTSLVALLTSILT